MLRFSRLMGLKPLAKQLFDLVRQAQNDVSRRGSPAAAACSRTVSISASLIKGITGANMTPAGTPAQFRFSRVFRRRLGEAALGSKRRARSCRSDVMDRYTFTKPCAAMGWSKSRSLSIIQDLVTMDNGCLQSCKTWIMSLVICSCRSMGWYGSVFVPIAMGLHM